MKKVNKLKSRKKEITRRNNTYNVHDPEFEVEVRRKSTSGK